MGRPYRRELERISDSIEWASLEDVSSLAAMLAGIRERQLLTIGSGGSFVAAAFAAMLHESFFGEVAKPITPLEAATAPPTGAAALLLSARGNNPDILEAFRQLALKGHPRIGVVCTKIDSALGKLAQENGHDSFGFKIPTGRDGYLATNSLITTLVLLYRAFALASGETPEQGLFGDGDSPENWIEDWVLAGRLAEKETLIVLSETWGQVAATDLESRFAEAALGNVSVADYRNFAHGRHHWLDKRGTTSAVISLETPDSDQIASRTLALLPPDTNVMRIRARNNGPLGAIELVRASMALALAAGEERGVDPGRPTVAQFGRQLYRSRSTLRHATTRDRWVSLKSRALGLPPRANRAAVEVALSAYLERLRATTIRAIAIDYDGTLSAADRRYSPLEPEVTAELTRLLVAGLQIGIATGRGRSAIEELRGAIPQQYWRSIIMGLHNGNTVLQLDSDEATESGPTPEIQDAADVLAAVRELLGLRFDVRQRQISVHPSYAGGLESLHGVIEENLRRANVNLRVVRSSHSLDVLMPEVSKAAVVCALEQRLKHPVLGDEILRIGDRGDRFGNDFELLGSGLSLSVDEASADLSSCWNLSPAGTRGHKAAVAYLRAIVESPAGFRFDPARLLAVQPRK